MGSCRNYLYRSWIINVYGLAARFRKACVKTRTTDVWIKTAESGGSMKARTKLLLTAKLILIVGAVALFVTFQISNRETEQAAAELPGGNPVRMFTDSRGRL